MAMARKMQSRPGVPTSVVYLAAPDRIEEPAAVLRGFRALYLAIPINLLVLGWVTRARTGRAVRVTPIGRDGLADVFGLTIAA